MYGVNNAAELNEDAVTSSLDEASVILAARWNANVQTMVLPRVPLTTEEVAVAVGQQATVFRELASALVEIRLPIVLGFPNAQALRRFFAARRERPLAA
jgi:hypothetical protein